MVRFASAVNTNTNTGLVNDRFRDGESKLTEDLRGNAVVPQRDGFERDLARDGTHQIVQSKWCVGFGER
jgi:hypothetical protein